MVHVGLAPFVLKPAFIGCAVVAVAPCSAESVALSAGTTAAGATTVTVAPSVTAIGLAGRARVAGALAANDAAGINGGTADTNKQ